MASTSPDPLNAPLSWSFDGTKNSLLFTLHAPDVFPTYEDALKRDLMLRGIKAVPSLPPVDADVATSYNIRTHATTSPPSVTPSFPAMATGGGFASHTQPSSLGSTRPSTPLLAHPATPSPYQAPQTMQVPPAQQMPGMERLVTLESLDSKAQDGNALPYFGYSLQVEISVPGDWSAFQVFDNRGRTNWPNADWHLVAADDGVISKYRLLVDTGGGSDSWVFTNLTYDSLGKNEATDQYGMSVVAWDDNVHRHSYENKSKIPYPPQDHVDDSDNRADFHYGITEYMSVLSVAQTLIKLRVNSQGYDYIDLPASAIGVALAITPGQLSSSADGILGHGRKYGPSSTSFGSSVYWKSRTILEILLEARMINEARYTIYIDHPTLKDGMPSCIIYGPPFDPGYPSIPGPGGWTHIPVANSQDYPGHWMVFLSHINYTRPVAGTNSRKVWKIDVGEYFSVDSGASLTFVPAATHGKLVKVFADIGGRYSMLPSFQPDDEVELVFKRDQPSDAMYTVTGQAKRFFTSPLLTGRATDRCCVETSGNLYLLGMNFFMTFIVSFEDAQFSPRLAVHPHKYV